MTGFFAIIFTAQLSIGATVFEPLKSVGPYADETSCYDAAVQLVGELTGAGRERTFRALCRAGDGRLIRLPGERPYDLRELIQHSDLTL